MCMVTGTCAPVPSPFVHPLWHPVPQLFDPLDIDFITL